MARVRCPACEAELEVDAEDLGSQVACGACGAPFEARPAAPRGDADDRPRRRDRDESDWEEDEDDRPRRRRRRVRAADVEDARAAVAGPALGLILTGWIGAVLCLLGGAALAVWGYSNLEAKDPKLRDDAPGMLAAGVASAVLGTPYCVLMAVGGHRMKRLTGTGWAFTAAILGIATVVLCGPCVPITWAGVGCGIWAIVAVNKPEVRDVIAANRRADRDDEDEDR